MDGVLAVLSLLLGALGGLYLFGVALFVFSILSSLSIILRAMAKDVRRKEARQRIVRGEDYR